MFALRDIAMVLVVFGSLPFIFVRPWIGILMWSWISYMVPHRMSWDFARTFQFALIIALATIVAWLLSRENNKKLPVDTISILLIALSFWISITTVFAIVPDSAFGHWETSIKVLFMTVLTLFLMQTRTRIEALVWVIVCSVGFFGIKGGIWTLLTGGASGRVYGPPGGFFFENNSLGLTLVMIVPLIWYLQTRVEHPVLKWGLRGAIALCMLSVIGTHSRGAALAAGAMVVFLFIKSRKRALLAFGLVVGVIAATPFIPERWYTRIETIKEFEHDRSAMGRIHAWTFAVRLALDRPLVGGGFKVEHDQSLFLSYVPEAEKSRAFHSIYFQTLGEHGFIGLAIFLLLGVSAFLAGSGIIRRTRASPELHWANDLARMLQVSIFGYAVGGAFLNLAFFDLYYHLVAIMLLVKVVVAKEAAELEKRDKANEVEAPLSHFRAREADRWAITATKIAARSGAWQSQLEAAGQNRLAPPRRHRKDPRLVSKPLARLEIGQRLFADPP